MVDVCWVTPKPPAGVSCRQQTALYRNCSYAFAMVEPTDSPIRKPSFPLTTASVQDLRVELANTAQTLKAEQKLKDDLKAYWENKAIEWEESSRNFEAESNKYANVIFHLEERIRLEKEQSSKAEDQCRDGEKPQPTPSTPIPAEAELNNLRTQMENLQSDNNGLKEQVKVLVTEKETLQNNVKHWRTSFTSERDRRIRISIAYVTLRGGIQVLCRPKPSRLAPNSPGLHTFDTQNAVIRLARAGADTEREKSKDFVLDRVFDRYTTNKMIWDDEIEPLVGCFLAGRPICIVTYGQTGSGKTYLMSEKRGLNHDGHSAETSIIPRVVKMIFEEKSKIADKRSRIYMSCIEVYLNRIHNLLHAKNDTNGRNLEFDLAENSSDASDPASQTRSGKAKSHWRLVHKPEKPVPKGGKQELRQIEVSSFDAFMKAFDQAMKRRTTKDMTDLGGKNATSSRSHTIFTLHIGISNDEASTNAVGTDASTNTTAVIQLVDLAGSEEMPTGNKEAIGESKFINTTLHEITNALRVLRNQSVTRSKGQLSKDEEGNFEKMVKASRLLKAIQPSLDAIQPYFAIIATVHEEGSAKEAGRTLGTMSRIRETA